jgi:hypothetical protein
MHRPGGGDGPVSFASEPRAFIVVNALRESEAVPVMAMHDLKTIEATHAR